MQPKLDFAIFNGDIVTYVLSPQKTNLNITIVAFRVPLDISQSSLNMMEIQHLTM